VVVPPDLPRIEGETDEAYAARLDEARRQTAQQAIKDAMGPYNDGWYLDLPGDGEQSNTDPSLQRKTLVFTTNRPLEGGGCVPTATSFRYFLDYRRCR
jgi:Tfp pilus tip-associated adhesin PilY1